MALVGRWTLDGHVQDVSGQGNNGTLTGALYSNGKNSPGLWFDGVDDKVDCGTGSSIAFVLSNPFTAMAWVNNTLGSDDLIVGNSWGGPGWHLRVTSTNKIRMILVGSGGTTYRYVDSTRQPWLTVPLVMSNSLRMARSCACLEGQPVCFVSTLSLALTRVCTLILKP